MKQRIAIFDLDKTLTQQGTWGRFVTGAVRPQPHKWVPFLFSTLFYQVRYMLGFGPRAQVKEAMMRWTIAGRSKSELENLANSFADNEIDSGLRKRAPSVLEKHKSSGDRILIASAAVDLIVHPIAERLDITETVCTRTGFDGSGRLENKLAGRNCYGPGKLALVKEYLESDPKFVRDNVHITMYSDCRSDLDILEWADIGIAVNPSSRLVKYLPKYGFEAQDWDQEI